MNPVARRLVMKDVRLSMPLMAMMLGAGLVAVALMMTGRTGYAVGGIMFITASLAGGFFLAAHSIMLEHKDQSALFALSLPVSVTQLQYLKLVTALLIYGMPWLLLTLAACTAILFIPRFPDGTVVFALMVQGCALAITTAYCAVVTLWRSEAVSGFSILVLNMGFSLFIISFSQPALNAPLRTDRIVWPDYALLTLGVELLVVVGAPLIALLVLSRRRDYF
jgi:hypothetical protein